MRVIHPERTPGTIARSERDRIYLLLIVSFCFVSGCRPNGVEQRTGESPACRPKAAAKINASAPQPDKPPAGCKDEAVPTLTIWAISNRDGIAIALNDLRKAPDPIVIERETAPHKCSQVDLHQVLRDLLDEERNEQMYSFRLRRKIDSYHVWFKFAKEKSLTTAWRPLFKFADPGETSSLETLAGEYPGPWWMNVVLGKPEWLKELDWLCELQTDLENQDDKNRVVLLGPGSSDAVPALWFYLSVVNNTGRKLRKLPIVSTSATWSVLNDPSRVCYYDFGLRLMPEVHNESGIPTVGKNLVIVADVNKVLHFRIFDAHGNRVVDKNAGDLLERAREIEQLNGQLMDLWTVKELPNSAEVRVISSVTSIVGYTHSLFSQWVVTLSRAMGLSSDNYHLRHANAKDSEQLQRVTQRVKGIADTFIQYAQSDEQLVDAVLRELVDVQGYRRVALLYRDNVATGGADDRSPELTRRLYGPSLSDEFRKKFPDRVDVFLDAPFKLSPTRAEDPAQYNTKFAQWEIEVKSQLKPILRFFERERIEAVGVFGDDSGEKRAVLSTVREELPWAQLFTSDPDWQLESPTFVAPTNSGMVQPKPDPVEGSYKLDGLLVFANSVPDRPWIRHQFSNLNELASGRREAFLPGIFNYYTAHVVKRLIEIPESGQMSILDQPRKRTRTKDHGDYCWSDHGCDAGNRCSLECFLRSPTEKDYGDKGVLKELELKASGVGDPEILLIRNGRLHPLSEGDLIEWRTEGWGGWLYAALLFLSLVWIGWLIVHLRRPWAEPHGDGDLPPITPWDYFFKRISPSGPLNLVRAARVITTIVGVGLLSLLVDASFLKSPISLSFLPDGHSVLPSVLIMSVAAVFAYHLPHRFRSEFNSRGLLAYRSGPQDPGKVWALRRWVPPLKPGVESKFDGAVKTWINDEVNPRLRIELKEVWGSAAAAMFLVVLDGIAGLPVPGGITLIFLLALELILLWLVISTGWTVFQVVVVPGALQGYLAKAKPIFRLRHLDLVGIGRVGAVFIETITYMFVIFGLLLVARLPTFGMARWRWYPIGTIIALGALVFILYYWLRCYDALRSLIRDIKRDRLKEYERLRVQALNQIEEDLKKDRAQIEENEDEAKKKQHEVEKKKREAQKKREEASEAIEKQRRLVEQIPEQPWEASEARRAWIALFLALLPPILTLSGVLGSWNDSLVHFFRSILGS